MNNQAGRLLGGSVLCVAGLVVVGWFSGIDFLKSIHPEFVTMKLSTAACFVVSGLLIRFMAHPPRGLVSGVIESWLVFCIVGYMTLVVIPPLYGVSTGIENWMVPEDEAVFSSSPGMPSVGTLTAFLLISLAAFINVVIQGNAVNVRRFIGSSVVGIGLLALLGYAFWQPGMFYYLPPYSSAMAIHTAVLFVLCGAAIVAIMPRPLKSDYPWSA